jgi:hypothetical protein
MGLDMSKEIWFKNKTYGWGWTPCAWQGWTVTAAFVAALTVVPGMVSKSYGTNSVQFWLALLGLVAGLLGVCVWKGEKPRWNWPKR